MELIKKNVEIENEDVGLSLAYELIKSEADIEDYGKATVYGIKILQKNFKRNTEEIFTVKDISGDYQKVKDLLELMAKNTVTIITAAEIIEDYI